MFSDYVIVYFLQAHIFKFGARLTVSTHARVGNVVLHNFYKMDLNHFCTGCQNNVECRSRIHVASSLNIGQQRCIKQC